MARIETLTVADPTPINAQSTDILLLHVTLPLPPQHTRLLLTWTQANRRHQLPILARVDAHPQMLVVPIGAHPSWQGTVQQLRVLVPYRSAPTLQIERIERVRRSPLALDLGVLRVVAPWFPLFPPLAHVQLVVFAVLSSGVVVALPWSHWRRRLALWGMLLAGGAVIWAIGAHLRLTTAVVAGYGSLTEPQALALAPAFESNPQATAQLVAIADQLPNGSVALLDVMPVSDLLHRARYLFYPRTVLVHNPQDAPTMLPTMLAQEYVAAIQVAPSDTPPAPGWERLPSTGPLAVWVAPQHVSAPARPTIVGPWAMGVLAAGIVGVLVLGWCLADLLGIPQGLLRLGAAWPLGTALLAWWMWLLVVSRVPWSLWSIGLPLLVSVSLARWWAMRTRRSPPERWQWHWSHFGWVIIGILVGSTLLQAAVLPPLDRDSWRLWAFRGVAFYLDGALEPMLIRYRDVDVHHSSYPPAQSLTQTWLYILLGGISDRLIKVIFVLWYLAGALLVGWICQRWAGRTAGVGWALVWASTPLVLDHAALNNADLPLAVMLLLAGIMLACWVEDGVLRWLLSGSVALAAAAWIKLDGGYLGVAMLAIAVGCRAVRYWSNRVERRQAGMAGVWAVGLLAVLSLPWTIFTLVLGLNDLPGTTNLQQAGWTSFWEGLKVIVGEVLFSYNNSSLGLLGGGYGVLWLVCGGALVIGWRRIRVDPVLWFLLLSMSIGFTLYLAIYILRPYYSVERYLLHLAPLMVIAAARASQGVLQSVRAYGLKGT
jgi:hypothetical protein